MALIEQHPTKPNTYGWARRGRKGPTLKIPYVEFKKIKIYTDNETKEETDAVETFRIPVDGCHGVCYEGMYTALEQIKRQGAVVIGGGDFRLGKGTGDEGIKAWVDRETQQIDPRLRSDATSVIDQRLEAKKNAKKE
jgi:hypothetical protein